jgi:hypothetical protein
MMKKKLSYLEWMDEFTRGNILTNQSLLSTFTLIVTFPISYSFYLYKLNQNKKR